MSPFAPIVLRLFVVASTPRSLLAIENIRAALAELPDGAFLLEIVNVFDAPEIALADRVLVTPTLLSPATATRLVGDLSERNQLRYFLESLPAA